ncbi:FMN-binding negative transcriptional regulator [Hasllibacter sp. MH4015]|uniref:FMN-binding negative transcriptional regulator n=1 Tax=Hasllibacter sp. MH4015 TaxID=2854029 RepID=UPI001CD80469|nr:FMN-binding negative transcriptional regulator [Hasllibacter sp. MH4015]
MHPNPAFRKEPDFLNLTLCRKRGFGMLCLNADPAPLISHVPFFLDEAGQVAELHLVRSNPIARHVTQATPAVIVVNGPDGYVSPDWYDMPDQVPTWNYVAVHLRGVLHPMDEGLMRKHLDRLSGHFEGRLAPKLPWTTDKMSDTALERMMRQILPFRFEVTQVDGTWKLNQNKPDAAREGAAEAIRQSPIGHELETLSALMTGGVPSIDKGTPLTYI